MKYVKAGIAALICLPGLLLPWRCRVLYSEFLGWLAQLVPPSMYQVSEIGQKEAAEKAPSRMA